MSKQSIITCLRGFVIPVLARVAMAGQSQTKTATITGYSPALKDGTVWHQILYGMDVSP